MVARKEGHQYFSFGPTEKPNHTNYEVVSAANPRIPPFAILGLKGLLEELVLEPSPEIQLSPETQRPQVLNPFSLTLFPFGIIHNLNRENSPLCLVIGCKIIGGRIISTKEPVPELMTEVELENIANQSSTSHLSFDSWSQAIALHWSTSKNIINGWPGYELASTDLNFLSNRSM